MSDKSSPTDWRAAGLSSAPGSRSSPTPAPSRTITSYAEPANNSYVPIPAARADAEYQAAVERGELNPALGFQSHAELLMIRRQAWRVGVAPEELEAYDLRLKHTPPHIRRVT